MPTSCPLTTTHVLQHVCVHEYAHVHIHTCKFNKKLKTVAQYNYTKDQHVLVQCSPLNPGGKKLGMVACTCNPSSQETARRDHEFQGSLGNTGQPYLKVYNTKSGKTHFKLSLALLSQIQLCATLPSTSHTSLSIDLHFCCSCQPTQWFGSQTILTLVPAIFSL